MAFGVQAVVEQSFQLVVDELRLALVAEGLAVVSMTDLSVLLNRSFGLEIPPQVILGVCSRRLAEAALQADASVGLLIPCDVVVRAIRDDMTVVESARPNLMVAVTGDPHLEPVAAEVTTRIRAALVRITEPSAGGPADRLDSLDHPDEGSGTG